ncbi:STAS/SEC14 domain-containing protein [Polyangium sp. 15x6]|uniref:STAS/SEC14 domain-containing protein n=1 Tax=Polyangium sp. 15x6 TaxID=3042687 RepID=UPI00249B585D|nr:STAS/SEC14 domain-containing protein [Polyangium sp. 15x6]MDI3285958.1 STAS/SEC14 domain-containing protein [Polyangium sp. 15x6]
MRVGAHDIEVETPDLVVLCIRGEVLTADAQAFGTAMKAHARGGTAFMLSIIEGEIAMSSTSRKALIEAMRGLPRLVNAVVGASFGSRVLAQLVATAARVLARTGFDLAFFDDEPSARAWLRARGCVACGAPSGPDSSSGLS